jgi:hypothetical protein
MNPVVRFGKLLKSGTDALLEACRLYVEAIDEDIKLKAVFFETYPEISDVAWRRFEDAGRGRLHPKLLVNYNYPARRLAACPYEQQVKYVDHPFEVLQDDGTTISVALSRLTAVQAVQVFNDKGVRTVAEQLVYKKAQKTPKASVKKSLKGKHARIRPPYQLSKGKLIVNIKCAFTKSELLLIIMQLEKESFDTSLLPSRS